MKISENTYYCEWCSNEFIQEVGQYISSAQDSKGKQNVSSQCICPNCFAKVSQKTKLERESKIAKGEKI